jgi:hypothetical protein
MSSIPTAQWLDSTGRLQRELDAVKQEINEQRAKVDDLNSQLLDWKQKQAAAPAKGWLSSAPVKMEIKGRELKLEAEQPLLYDLEAGYQELTTDLFPTNRTWTFDEADHFIVDLLQQLTAEADRGGYLVREMAQDKISIPMWDPKGTNPLEIDPAQFAPLKGLMERVGSRATQLFDSKRRKLRGIKTFRLILYLNRVYAERRSLLPAYLPAHRLG